MNRPPLLIPTSDEHNGMQHYIYRSFFPITLYITESSRILNVICTIDFLSREETLALLSYFGFIRSREIDVSRKGPNITFSQELITVNIPESPENRFRSKTHYHAPDEREESESLMCCRYFIDDKADEFAEYFEQAAASPLKDKMVARLARPLKTSGEINPTDMVPVIARDKKGLIRAFPMVWGFSPNPPRRGRPVVNARAETAATLSSFRDAWASHRCIVPASYFFEWGPPMDESVPLTKGGKARYIIQPTGTSVTWFAALYHTETVNDMTYPTFTILTRDSAGEMRPIHDRMPVIFPSSLIEEWIAPQCDPAKLIRRALTDLYVAAG